MNGKKFQLRIGGPITPAVKAIMIANGAIFIFQQLFSFATPGLIESYFGLSYIGVFNNFWLWQLITYMFLHGGWFHVIFNLIGMWMFAGELENLWGSRVFLKYYLITGIGAGIFITLMNYYIFAHHNISPITIGASGAIYGILLAYGLTWPNRQVLLYFVIPIKIKYLVIVFGLIEFFGTVSSFSGGAGDISHIGHLGGIISGMIYIFFRIKPYGKSYGTKVRSKMRNPLSEAIKRARMSNKRKEIETRIKAKEIIDHILEKITRDGMESLTDDDKKQLEWARRHYYPEENKTIH